MLFDEICAYKGYGFYAYKGVWKQFLCLQRVCFSAIFAPTKGKGLRGKSDHMRIKLGGVLPPPPSKKDVLSRKSLIV